MAGRRHFKTDHVTHLTYGWRRCRVKRDMGTERRHGDLSFLQNWKLKERFPEYPVLMSVQSLGRFSANDLEFPGEKLLGQKKMSEQP